jgi:hypothetical protein
MLMYIILLIILLILYLKYYYNLKIQLISFLLVKKGLVTFDCFWYNVSDIILKDSSGINLYYDLKKNNLKDFYKVNIYGKSQYILLNPLNLKFILNNSPNIFEPGNLKVKFFNMIMKNNVGISKGCKWKHRRLANEKTLPQNNDYFNQKVYDKIKEKINYYKDEDFLDFKKLKQISLKITAFIIFGNENIDSVIVEHLKDVNNFSVLWDMKYKINNNLKRKFRYVLKKYIKNPIENSLVYELVKNKNLNLNELIDQIPHFIFPIFSICPVLISRILLILTNHKTILNKVIEEVKSIGDTPKRSIYLRKIILEMVRLNNPVNTITRNINKDILVGDKRFKKNDQILIFNNPILRDPTKFINPNKFIPNRWNHNLENDYHNVTFNQGPQKCPGKELTIFIAESFIRNLFLIKKPNIISKKINTNYIPQSINPCNLEFLFIS